LQRNIKCLGALAHSHIYNNSLRNEDLHSIIYTTSQKT